MNHHEYGTPKFVVAGNPRYPATALELWLSCMIENQWKFSGQHVPNHAKLTPPPNPLSYLNRNGQARCVVSHSAGRGFAAQLEYRCPLRLPLCCLLSITIEQTCSLRSSFSQFQQPMSSTNFLSPINILVIPIPFNPRACRDPDRRSSFWSLNFNSTTT